MRRVKQLTQAAATLAEHKANIRAALVANGDPKPYGTREGRVSDSAFDADLNDILGRVTAHNITHEVNGVQITESVSVKPETLEVLIDDNNEVIGWIYKESV